MPDEASHIYVQGNHDSPIGTEGLSQSGDNDPESGEYVAMHHPFTSPLDECIPYLESDKSKVRAKAYDLVLNGIELSSGSIRITDYELQQRMFKSLGLTEEEIEAKFGFLLEAYRYGAPPHAGLAFGLDRLVALLLGIEDIRDVIAFPKNNSGRDVMLDAPGFIDQQQLDELCIKIKE